MLPVVTIIQKVESPLTMLPDLQTKDDRVLGPAVEYWNATDLCARRENDIIQLAPRKYSEIRRTNRISGTTRQKFEARW
jgi:hypothetical protein